MSADRYKAAEKVTEKLLTAEETIADQKSEISRHHRDFGEISRLCWDETLTDTEKIKKIRNIVG